MNFEPGKEYDAKMNITSMETTGIKAGASFIAPTEKTKKVQEALIKMCIGELNKTTKECASKNSQITLVPEGTMEKQAKAGKSSTSGGEKKKKLRKMTPEEKAARAARKAAKTKEY